MGFLSRLFGQCGTLRFEGTLENGQQFDGTIEIESFNTSSELAVRKIKDMLYMKYGWRVRELELMAFVES